MRKKLLAIIATAAMVVTMIPAMAFAAGSVKEVGTYEHLVQALKDGEKNIAITNDITVDEWDRIGGNTTHIQGCQHGGISLDGVTIEGNNKTIKVKKIDSNQNADVLFASAGGFTLKNITIDLSEYVGTRNHAALSLGEGDTISNVTIQGTGSDISYGLFAHENPGKTEPMTVLSCNFKTLNHAVMQNSATDVQVKITNSTFSDCDYAIIFYGKDGLFDKNIVNEGKVNVYSTGKAAITNNTFDGKSRIKFYTPEGVASFTGNKINDDSFIATDAAGFANDGTIKDIEKNIYENPETALGNLGLSSKEIEKIVEASEKYAEDQNKPSTPAAPSTPSTPEKSPNTGDNSALPFAVTGLALAAMAAVVATRRRTN